MKGDQEECDECDTCGEPCPVDVFGKNDEKRFVISPDECLVCSACGVQRPNAVSKIIK